MHRFAIAVAIVVSQAPSAWSRQEKKSDAPDILVADFEGPDYGAWTTTGTAFGMGPARGTFPNQMPVTGFLGKGLVNSYLGGDASTGTLTSPPLKIERNYINFLIGGGKFPGKTCINLLVGGKVVRTATGPNDQPGGSEQLDWHSWDVKEFVGKEAVIEIVDRATGGWGHINIDHIVQSNRKQGTSLTRREIAVTSRYLHLPLKNGAAKKRMKFLVDGAIAREFEIELADGKADFWVFSDVSAFRGKTLTIETLLPQDSKALAAIEASDELPDAARLYQETNRPQFHFTSRRGWLNDPNGLVFANGEYHLFYQHNPYGWGWGNMHWGHAVSPDLLHWQEVGVALYPRKFGDWCFSGSAVVDKHNTSGFKKGDNDLLVAAFTSTGRGECIVYSNDRGRTWTEYECNPVIKHRGRDPRLLWHEPTKRWVMAVYDEEDGKKIAFYSSPDLKEWSFHSRIGEFFECPDLFSLPLDGDAKKQKWVLYAADSKYLLGDFDGQTFRPESKLQQVWYGNMYAAQTFSDTPDQRRLQIGWSRVEFPGMPFNQQMTVPCELTLRSTSEGARMFVQPVREIDKLCGDAQRWKNESVTKQINLLGNAKVELCQLRAEIEPHNATRIILNLRGSEVVFDAVKKTLSCRGVTAPLVPMDGKIQLHILVDLGSIEIFGNHGRVAMSVGALAPPDNQSLTMRAEGGAAKIVELEVHPLRSIWPK